MKRGTSLPLSRAPVPPYTNLYGVVIDSTAPPHSVIDSIDAYEAAVRAGHCGQETCARCESGRFARHELRRRKLRVIVDGTVRILSLVIARWRCCHCRYVFTDYPDFRTPLQAIRQFQLAPACSDVS